MKNIPREIVDVYKTSIVLIILGLIIGAILNISELYLAFPLGGVFALINSYLLSKEVYKMVYIKENIKYRNPFGFFIRMGIFIVRMLVVIYITKSFYPNKINSNIIFTGLGFMIFKISIFINQKIKKFAKIK